MRALGWRGPVLLLEGCFEPRDLELCSRLNLWHVVHHEAQIDWLAAHKTAAAAPRVPQAQQRHEPAGLRADGLSRRVAAAERAAAGRRDHADDALLRRRRRARHRARSSRCSSAPTRRPGRANASLANSAAMLRHAPAARAATGCAPASWCYGSAPDYPGTRHRALEPAADDDPALAASSALQQLAARRQRRLRQQLHRRARRCASASSPAAMPTAIRATRRAARRCWSTACARGIVGRVSMDMITVDLTPRCRTPASAARSRCGAAARSGTRAADRRRGAAGEHRRLRADVRAGAARAGAHRGLTTLDSDASHRVRVRRARGRASKRDPRARRRRPERQQGVERGACCASTSSASSLARLAQGAGCALAATSASAADGVRRDQGAGAPQPATQPHRGAAAPVRADRRRAPSCRAGASPPHRHAHRRSAACRTRRAAAR